LELVIITGMSGAGKSQAVDALEDIGYYCVDNVPPSLLYKFVELPAQSGGKISQIALVVDVRSKDMFADYFICLEGLRTAGYRFQILFLDCSDEVLTRRFKETRRRHPLLNDDNAQVGNAIREERGLLQRTRDSADMIIDTSLLSAGQLKSRVQDLFATGVAGQPHMTVNCMSFGFKYGLPADSDLVFDVRCLPNPFYVEELRPQTGLQEAVREYVLSFPQAQGLVPHLLGFIDYLIPLYIQEGKSQLVVSVGCTGGRHRSVVFCQLLADHLAGKGFRVSTNHRDIGRGG